ncbi:MAG: hypothetical protein WBM70_06270 [Sulfurovum sp.]|uniref:hypothetical protein n=1 Tax=Sulfurovum sp. TaxID=1969726 RepID=UPI003C7524F9
MSLNIFLKTAMIWFIIAIFAIINGIFRETVLAPYLGESVALPASGITLAIIIFTITYISFKLFGKNKYLTYLYIGIQFATMTLVFEFIFGHYVIGKSWSDLLQVFNIFEGNLFIIALLSSLFSPLLVAKIKKL